jgi:peptide/nickel transport system substrate-binding protein
MTLQRLAVFTPLLVVPLAAAWLAAAPGEPAPLRPDDLLREAKNAPPGIAAVLGELAVPADRITLADGRRLIVDPVIDYIRTGADSSPRIVTVIGQRDKETTLAAGDIADVRFYEQYVLDRIAELLKGDDTASTWAAEKALRAALRFSRSRRQAPGPGHNPWASGQSDLANRVLDVRRRLLQRLTTEDLPEALRWADVWLPLYSAESSMGDAVRAVWARRAEYLYSKGEYASARSVSDQLDATFPQHPPIDALRNGLRGHALTLLKESRDQPDAKAVALLEQALAIWPRLPGLRDELEQRKQSYQVLYVAVRDLPEYFSPARAWSDAERQAVALIFEGLAEARHDARLGTHYRTRLAEQLPAGTGVRRPVTVRRDVYWSDGQRVTAADVRHTLEVLAKSGHSDAAVWRGLFDPPRLQSDPFRLEIVYRQGLLDPSAPLCIKLLPQHAHGKALSVADDIGFARQPIGTGPYQLQGKAGADGRVYTTLHANPEYLRHGMPGPGSLREIRFFTWPAGDAELGSPLPQLALDPTPAQTAALRKHGITDVRRLPIPRVWFLGVNHRRPVLANVNVRLALAHAIDRHGLLERHFVMDGPGAAPSTVNGLFARGSWANSKVQQVPEELYRPEEARAKARMAAKDLAKAEWTLKYPAGDPRMDAAFKELADSVAKMLSAAEVHVVIRPLPLPPRALQTAVRERDFDLVYHYIDLPDRPAALAALFDPDESAVGKGGGNFLGYDRDSTLQTLLGSALKHRDFPMVREAMQTVHAHLYRTMPLIPLWQLPYTIALHGSLHTPEIDPLAVFADVAQWKLARP